MSVVARIETCVVDTCNNCNSRRSSLIGISSDFEYGTCANEFEYVRCGDCGLVYLRNRPDVRALPIIYPENYIPHRFNEHLGPIIAKLRSWVQTRKITGIRRYAGMNAVIVDVGTGNGELLQILRDKNTANWTLVGVDFAAEAVKRVRELGLLAVQSRFEDLQWRDLPAPQVIIMNQVIEHLADPAAAVAKAYDLLVPGGVLFIETPSMDGWDAKLFGKRHWGGWHTPRHWVLYDQETLGSLLTRVGFEVVETTYLLSPNFWLQSLHHYVLETLKSPRLAKYFDVQCFPSLLFATMVDMAQRALRGKTSNFRMVARKPCT